MADVNFKRLRQARAERESRERKHWNFRGFVKHVNRYYEWHPHNEKLADALEKVAAGKIKRLMVFEPPRHGKSEEVSRLFAAYYLLKNPRKQVGLCSYSAEIANDLSKAARDNYKRAGKPVNSDESAASNWRTAEGGGEWAAGVGGSITGRGFDLGIIDDPLKNAEEAYSSGIREKQKDWWQSTFYTRREPHAAIILIQTRWHEDDLAGWLLSREEESPECWHIVNFEAIKTIDRLNIPSTCTRTLDTRKPGEALCPARYDINELEKIRKHTGSAFWNAMYQQRPTAQEGEIWRREWFKSFDPFTLKVKTMDMGYDWDLAYTKSDRNSASAYVKAARDRENNIYIYDFDFRWLEFPELIRWMAAKRGPHYVEQKASGKSAVQTLKENNIAAYEVPVEGGDWLSRPKLASPIAENGHVFVARNILDRLLEDPGQGLTLFPNSTHSDVNDAFTQCLNRLFTRNFDVRAFRQAQFAPGVLSGMERF
jgi:hypothetical protein